MHTNPAALPEPPTALDPVTRFAKLTQSLTSCERLRTSLADERALCAAELHHGGASYSDIATTLSRAIGRRITRARAQQLVERGRAVSKRTSSATP